MPKFQKPTGFSMKGFPMHKGTKSHKSAESAATKAQQEAYRMKELMRARTAHKEQHTEKPDPRMQTESPNKFIGAVVGGLAKKALGGVAKKAAGALGKKLAGSKIGKAVAGSKIGKAASKASKIFKKDEGEGEESPATFKAVKRPGSSRYTKRAGTMTTGKYTKDSPSMKARKKASLEKFAPFIGEMGDLAQRKLRPKNGTKHRMMTKKLSDKSPAKEKRATRTLEKRMKTRYTKKAGTVTTGKYTKDSPSMKARKKARIAKLEAVGKGARAASPAKHTKYFGQNTSLAEINHVTKHNRAHRSGRVEDDHTPRSISKKHIKNGPKPKKAKKVDLKKVAVKAAADTIKSPNKWLLAAGKALIGANKRRQAKQDEAARMKAEGIQKAMSRSLS